MQVPIIYVGKVGFLFVLMEMRPFLKVVLLLLNEKTKQKKTKTKINTASTTVCLFVCLFVCFLFVFCLFFCLS